MKKILIFLLLCIIFSFAEEISDTTIIYDTIPPADSVIQAYEIAEDVEEIEETETVEEAEVEIIQDTVAALTIITTPDNANVLLNRRRVGNSPFSANNMTPDEYKIMILKDGFELFDTTITLVGGANETLLIDLISESTGKKLEVPATEEVLHNEETAADTTAAVSEDDKAKKKKKMDRIGIIIFLSVMVVLLIAQESGR